MTDNQGSDDVERAPEGWGTEYRGLLSTYETVTLKLHGVLTDILKQDRIDVVQVDHRTKSVDSFVGKLQRKRGQYGDPFREVTDLIGLRVITYYLEDLPRVEAAIRREFAIDHDNSVEAGAELDPDRFGYLSKHFVVSLGDSRSGLAEWATFGDKRAEIQVRTATQHAWAAVEHKLTYKSIQDVPRDLKRRLARLSAIFELADEQFSAARQAVDELEDRYAETLRRGDLNVEIDSSSLDAYVAESDTVSRFVEKIEELGGTVTPSDHLDQGRLKRDRRDLLLILDRTGVETIGDLDGLLKDRAGSTRFWKKHMKSSVDLDDWRAFIEDWITQDVMAKKKAEPDLIREIYASDAAEGLISAIHGKAGPS